MTRNAEKSNHKKPFYKRWKFWAIALGVLFIIGLFAPDEADIISPNAEEVKSEEEVAEEKAKEKELQKRTEEMRKKQKATEEAEAAKKAEEDSEQFEVRRAEVNDALYKIAEVSEGALTNVYVTPYAPEGILTQISVDVSDAWYHSQEYEKERFAETIYDAVKASLVDIGAIESYDETIIVTLYDGHGKELAKSKMLGGFKIKR